MVLAPRFPTTYPTLYFNKICVFSEIRVLFWNTHSRLTALCPGLPGWASTRKVKQIWILLKQEIVSGSGISWAVCKSALRSRQPCQHPTTQVFYRPDALPAAQPTASKHWNYIPNSGLHHGMASVVKLVCQCVTLIISLCGAVYTLWA